MKNTGTSVIALELSLYKPALGKEAHSERSRCLATSALLRCKGLTTTENPHKASWTEGRRST
jgi:hypothetical protein